MSDFDVCMKELNSRLHGVDISVENFMLILRFSMEVVEITKLKGSAQKELAIRLVRKIIVDAPISDSKEKLLLDMIDQGVLGNTVDLIVDASRGKLDINTVVKVASGCCGSFLKK
tara:strand:- start:93 stop:437 length:345 start_codon:yes stop_codon:yes gene_type:complete